MADFRCETRELAPAIAYVRLHGPLDWRSCAQVDEKLKALFAGGVNRLAIDLSSVGHLSSAAFGLLIYALDSTTRAKGALVIAAAPPHVMEVLRMLGLHQIFAFCDTVEEAERVLLSA